MCSPSQLDHYRKLQAAASRERTHWWSHLPGISAVMASDRNMPNAGFQLPRPVLPSARESQQTHQDPNSVCIPTIKVDTLGLCFAMKSVLQEAAGIIDSTLLHAPFLREPLFVPVPGSGRKALRDWYPEASCGNGQREREERHVTQLLSKFKYWLRYEEAELYQTSHPGSCSNCATVTNQDMRTKCREI